MPPPSGCLLAGLLAAALAFRLPFVDRPGLDDPTCLYIADYEVGLVRVGLDGSNPASPVPARPRPGIMDVDEAGNKVWWMDARGSLRWAQAYAASPPGGGDFGVQTVSALVGTLATPPAGMGVQPALGYVYWVAGGVYRGPLSGGAGTLLLPPPPVNTTYRGLAVDRVGAVVWLLRQPDAAGQATALLSFPADGSAAPTPSVVHSALTGFASDTAVVVTMVADQASATPATQVFVLVDDLFRVKVFRINTVSGAVDPMSATSDITNAHDIAVLGSTLFVASASQGLITGFSDHATVWEYKIDTDTLAVLLNEDTASQRSGVAVSATRLWWSDGLRIRVADLPALTNVLTAVSREDDDGVPPIGMAITPDGLIAWGGHAPRPDDPDFLREEQLHWVQSALNKANATMVAPSHAKGFDALAFHPDNRLCTAYFADRGFGVLQSAYFCGDDGNVTAVTLDEDAGGGVTVDGESGAVFFTDRVAAVKRYTAGGGVDVVATGDTPADVAVGPAPDGATALYWSEASALKRSTLDGDAVVSLATGLTAGAGVDVEPARGLVAVADAGTGQVSVMSTDGTSRTIVHTGTNVNAVAFSYCTLLPTPSNTPSASPSPSSTASPSASPSRTPSPTVTPTHSPTQTNILSNTPTPSATASPSPSPSATPSPTPTPSRTASPSPSPSHTPSPTPSISLVFEPEEVQLRVVGLQQRFVLEFEPGRDAFVAGLAADLATITGFSSVYNRVLPNTVTDQADDLLVSVVVDIPGAGRTAGGLDRIYDVTDDVTSVFDSTNLQREMAAAGRQVSLPHLIDLLRPLPSVPADNSLPPWAIALIVTMVLGAAVAGYFVWQRFRSRNPLSPDQAASITTADFVKRARKIMQGETLGHLPDAM